MSKNINKVILNFKSKCYALIIIYMCHEYIDLTALILNYNLLILVTESYHEK